MVTAVVALGSVASPAPRSTWQTVFDRDAEAVPYQSPQWTDALCRSTHRQDASRLYTFDDGAQMLRRRADFFREVADLVLRAVAVDPHHPGLGLAVLVGAKHDAHRQLPR